MDLKDRIEKLIQDVNPRLKRMVGAQMDLIEVNPETAEVVIKIIQNSSGC